MNDKQSMLRRLSSLRFAAWELHLFLDTHPSSEEARTKFDDYNQKADALEKEYITKYGPLRAREEPEGRWAWINDPWPWETEGN